MEKPGFLKEEWRNFIPIPTASSLHLAILLMLNIVTKMPWKDGKMQGKRERQTERGGEEDRQSNV